MVKYSYIYNKNNLKPGLLLFTPFSSLLFSEERKKRKNNQFVVHLQKEKNSPLYMYLMHHFHFRPYQRLYLSIKNSNIFDFAKSHIYRWEHPQKLSKEGGGGYNPLTPPPTLIIWFRPEPTARDIHYKFISRYLWGLNLNFWTKYLCRPLLYIATLLKDDTEISVLSHFFPR